MSNRAEGPSGLWLPASSWPRPNHPRSAPQFGARGSSSFFSRATAVCATAFFVSSLTLAYLSSQATSAPSSLLDEAPEVEAVIDEAPELSEEMPVSSVATTVMVRSPSVGTSAMFS